MFMVLSSCNSNKSGIKAEQESTQKKIDSMQSKAEETVKKFASYPEDSLLQKLHEDSRKMVEPFNSLAYRELVKRRNVDPLKLRLSVNTSDYTSFLNLLATRTLAKEQYRQLPDSLKVSILTDALSKHKTFNAWGLPHLKLEDGSIALIELGEQAVNRLKPLLQDCRPALFWGDEEYYEYKKYKYRLCDYAMIFIKQIRKEQFIISEKPEERDKLIAELK